MKEPIANTKLEFLSAGGEMGERIRNFDWSKTPLGSTDTWSQSLKSTIGIVLSNRFPMLLLWGPQYISLYNDAYSPILGAKHPNALSLPVNECWYEIWDVLKPLIDGPFYGGSSTWIEDFQLLINRKGFLEESHFTVAYSPVPDRTVPGGIGGVLASVHEIKEKVIQERALSTLRQIGAIHFEEESLDIIYRNVADALANNNKDFPFALVYKIAGDANTVTVAASTGIDKTQNVFPDAIDVTKPTAITKEFCEAFRENKMVVSKIKGEDVTLPTGAWQTTPKQFVHLPVSVAGGNHPYCIISAALNPYRQFDDTYRQFCQLIGDRVSIEINKMLPVAIERKKAEALAEIDRAKKYFNSNIDPAFDEAGKIVGQLATSIDVTEQILAREKIEEGKTYYQSITDNTPVMTWMTAPDGSCTFLNKRWYDYTGQSEETGMGFGWVSAVHKDDAKLSQEIFHDANEKQIPFNLTYRLRNIRGEYRWHLDSGLPKFNEDGEYEGMVGSVIDIHDLVSARQKIEESETQLQLITDALPVLIAYIDKNRSYRFTNKAYETWFGHSSKEISGKHIKDVLGEAAYRILEPKIDQVLSGKPVHSEMSVPYKDGGIRWVVADYIPHFGRDNEVLGYYGVVNDVTAIKKAEELNLKLASIVQSSTDAIISKTLDGIVTSWNPGAEKIFGYAAAEMIGESITKLIPDDRLDEEPRIIKNISQGKIVDPFDTQRLTKEGKLLNVSITISPVKDSEGKIIGASKIARDITGFIEARKKIEESEQRFHNLIFSSPSAIGILQGEDLIITIANEPIIEIWGKGKEIIGKKYFEALPELAEQGFKEVFAQVYKTGIPFTAIETPVSIVQNGETTLKYYNFILYPQRNLTNEVNGIGIIATEVTSQAILNNKIKEREKQFSTLANNIQNLAWIADGEGWIYWYNQRWYDYTGTTLEEMKGWGWQKVHHPDHVERIVEIVKKLWITNAPFELTFPLRRYDGEYRWFLTRAVPISDENGKIISWIGTNTDIEEQKTFSEQLEEKVTERTLQLNKVNENLEEKNSELQKMNKELEAFTYVSSHDLQEPLRKIQTYAGRIIATEKEHLSDTAKDYFDRMQVSASRMQKLLQDLLAFSRVSTSERKFEITGLNKIIDEVKDEFKEAIKERNAIITTGEMCEVNIISFQFSQLMHNLISNALKFSKKDVPTHIIIKSEIIKASNSPLANRDACHISVSDNGIGFEKHFSEKIFEVFQRLHNNEEYTGTGIGLAIVKKIVDNHSGIITAESELGKGATFNIYLPH